MYGLINTFIVLLFIVVFSLKLCYCTQKNVQREKGATILLPCDIDSAKCGDLHSIKWYRGSARIYVFSHVANIARPEGSNTSRMEVQYVPGSTESHLQIRALELTDEAVYKCEITYMEVRENCDVVQFVNLTTLVKPSEVRIKKDGVELEDGSLLGPYNEYTEVTLECEAIGGKPVPQVTWYNGSRKMNGDYSTVPDGITHGIGNGRSILRTTLQRGDLLTNYECRVENDALPSPIVKRLTVDVHVRPTDIKLTGVEKHVVKGTNVLLECNVRGARPAANVTWYNGTKPMKEISEINTKQTPNDDGTFETQSRLLFTASRFENGKSITCKADNSVMREERETPMDRTITLEVYYPPIVSVEPENITVNESVDVLLMCQYEANPASLNVTQWLKDGKNLTISDKEHYEGGDTDQTSLHIMKVTREDMGRYSCVLGNSVGQQESENDIFLNVHYKPVVRLTMDPPSPIIQKDQINVTLRCNVESGNPDTLLAVRWYMDGEMLKQLPDCNNTSAEEPFCDVDPNIMLLTNVGKEFAGNHTCEGMNEAGWGPRSNNTELIVYYPPTNTELIFDPPRVIKKSSVTLKCSVGTPGQPEITKYRWMRGEHLVPDITTAEWTINPVTLETRSDFTCIPYNEGGDAEPASVYIKVYAPPAIISKPHPYHGALYNAKHINISCRIECSPLCDVVWLKNDQLLDLDNTDLYYVIKNNISENIRTNDFESIHSVLVWNMTAWPNEQLDRLTDNANYTCRSKSNGVGEGVNLTIYFAVEYPPEQITLSNTVVNVIENHIPEKVLCSAKALPEPTYQWRRESTNEIIITGNKLIIDQPVPRQDAGNYICEVYNKHGTTASPTVLKVLYKPECQISQTVIDGNDVLVCSVKAEPEEVDFQWKINGGNETVDDELVKNDKLRSILTLDSSVEEKRTYLCYANNSVGTSFACERDVNGAIPFWKRMSNDELLILVAVILAVILCVTIICVIIIIVCRRKRANDKYNNPVELEEREKPEGHNNPPQEPPSSPSSATHKWPLKPGVLVHVNRMHSLSMGRLTNMSLAAGLNLTNNNNNNTTQSYSTVQNSTVTKTSSPSSCSSPTSRLYRNTINQRRAKSLGSLVRDADSGHTTSHHQSRAFRLKQIFTRGFGGTIDDTFAEGVFRGSSGVVTFKKLPTPSPNESTSSVSRKRKKPGQGPSQSNTADKNNLNKDNPSETLTDPDRGFYENLPFHGMQNPPNKPVSIITPLLTQAVISNTAITTPSKSTTATIPTTIIRPTPSRPIKHMQKLPPPIPPPPPPSTSIPNKDKDTYLINFNKIEDSSESSPEIPSSFTNHRDSLRRNIDSKKFYSLVCRKNKNPTPHFYSMRVCKKHNKRGTILAVSDSMLHELKTKAVEKHELFNTKSVSSLFQPPLIPTPHSPKNVPQSAQTRKLPKHNTQQYISDNFYENLTDSIQILEQNIVETERALESDFLRPKPAPRTKLSKTVVQDSHLYQNLPVIVSPMETSKTTEQLCRSKKVASLKPFAMPFPRNIPSTSSSKTPTIRNPPPNNPNVNQNRFLGNLRNNVIRPVPNIINKNQFYTLTPNFKHLTSTSTSNDQQQYSSNQYSNYSTMPPNRHLKLFPRTLFGDNQQQQSSMTQLNKSKSFSNKQKTKKPFQIPLQKCHSFKFQPTESYFQPIRPSINTDEYTENGHLKNPFADHQFGGYYSDTQQQQKSSSYLQNSSSIYHNNSSLKMYQQHSTSNDNIQMHLRKPLKFNNLGSSNISDKRSSTTGPLICVKNDIIPREYFHENNDFVKLQYPQPLYDGSAQNGGLVYADLSLSKTKLNSKKLSSNSSPLMSVRSDKLLLSSVTSLDDRNNQCKKPANRHKTEYATLKFNEIGQEIDV